MILVFLTKTNVSNFYNPLTAPKISLIIIDINVSTQSVCLSKRNGMRKYKFLCFFSAEILRFCDTILNDGKRAIK